MWPMKLCTKYEVNRTKDKGVIDLVSMAAQQG